jgi:peptide/nickel transport system substrate-binding protein
MSPADGYWSDVWMVKPVCITSWGERPADQILNEAYRSTSSWNETFYNNPKFDALLDQARAEQDFAKRKALYVAAQQMLFDDGGSFIAYNMNGVRVVNAAVTGFPAQNDDYVAWQLVDKAGD